MSVSAAEISITKLELCWLLLAQTVKFVGPKGELATPVRLPELSLNSSGAGRAGDTSQVTTSPPNRIGYSAAWVTLTVRLSEVTG